MKKEGMKEEVKMKKAVSGTTMAWRVPLVQSGGILATLFGLLLGTPAVNKAVGGTINLKLVIFGTLFFEADQVLALVLSIVGIIALVGGIALCYVGFKLQPLSVICIILGSCDLIIPSMILGLGYNLVAGIVALAIGYPWLATLFYWLKG